MPQFVMEGILEPGFQALDAFTQGYIEAMFFTETDPSVTLADCEAGEVEWNEGTVPVDSGFADLHPDSLEAIKALCERFQTHARHTLSEAYAVEIDTLDKGRINYDPNWAGHDFWLTRNDHGAGFWDRGLGQVGDDLTELAKAYGEANVWFADHVTHGSAPYVYHE